ncbi:hypothetical protein IAD21_04865 [Abditibacteriota bacterium]|nr:hypothetical protein IAD21_04865 [Abditibacteriota bacterium]
MEKKAGPGRPADRQHAIVHELRGRIMRGELAPGARLPTHVTLEEGFGVSAMTIQRALSQLKSDGFVRVEGKRGTFVVDALPHLSRYALIFPVTADKPGWTRFWTALVSEAASLSHRGDQRDELPAYFGVDGHEDSPDYVRLVRDMHAHRVGGLIFASGPHELQHTPLFTWPGVARVSLADDSSFPMPSVWVDMDGFFQRALDCVQSAGRRRVAFLHPRPGSQMRPRCANWLHERGLETRPYWWQSVSLESRGAARELMHLLMHAGAQHSPDALVISDDNLLEPATQGLLDAGCAPRDVEIVTHCNFPYPTPALLPVTRLGFDTRAVLNTCMQAIAAQRTRTPFAPLTRVPALLECELGF